MGTEKSGDGVEFNLTSEGEKFFDDQKAEFSGRGSFCTGKMVVTEVINFTELAERGGQKVSVANFTQKSKTSLLGLKMRKSLLPTHRLNQHKNVKQKDNKVRWF